MPRLLFFWRESFERERERERVWRERVFGQREREREKEKREIREIDERERAEWSGERRRRQPNLQERPNSVFIKKIDPSSFHPPQMPFPSTPPDFFTRLSPRCANDGAKAPEKKSSQSVRRQPPPV